MRMGMRVATAPITAGRVSTTAGTGPGRAARPQAPSGHGSASRAARTALTPTRNRSAIGHAGPFQPVGAPGPAAGPQTGDFLVPATPAGGDAAPVPVRLLVPFGEPGGFQVEVALQAPAGGGADDAGVVKAG